MMRCGTSSSAGAERPRRRCGVACLPALSPACCPARCQGLQRHAAAPADARSRSRRRRSLVARQMVRQHQAATMMP